MKTDVTWKYELFAPGKFRQSATSLPPLGGHWVQVRFMSCSICGSDISSFEGRRKDAFPISLGHEFVALVEGTGPNVTTLKKGDMVTTDFNYRCGKCDMCTTRKSHMCIHSNTPRFTHRAFSNRALVLEQCLYILPKSDTDMEKYCLSEPLSCALHAISNALTIECRTVLLLGLGGIGVCMAFALENTFENVVFDVHDTNPYRKQRVLDAASKAREMTSSNGLYDLVFDVTGTPDGLRRAIQMTANGGEIVSMSHLDGYEIVDDFLSSLTRRDIRFTMSYLNGEAKNMEKAINLIELSWDEKWSHTTHAHSIHDIEQVFHARKTSRVCKDILLV